MKLRHYFQLLIPVLILIHFTKEGIISSFEWFENFPNRYLAIAIVVMTILWLNCGIINLYGRRYNRQKITHSQYDKHH